VRFDGRLGEADTGNAGFAEGAGVEGLDLEVGKDLCKGGGREEEFCVLRSEIGLLMGSATATGTVTALIREQDW